MAIAITGRMYKYVANDSVSIQVLMDCNTESIHDVVTLYVTPF